ncbi:condensation domain-containing protein [Streptomyces sp. NPDC055025]
MTGPSTTSASWNQRHRLRQTINDAAVGVFNPHHCPLAFQVEGPLDLAVLDRAWGLLQRRHPGLLTTFGADNDTWCLETSAEPAPLIVRSVPGAPGGAGTAEAAVAASTARTAIVAAASQPFDPYLGPLARMVAVEIAPRRFEVCLVADHLVSDGWSGDVLLRDLRALYRQEALGEPCALPEIAMSFPDFVVRQNTYLESPPGLAARRHIAAALEDVGVLPRVEIQGFSGVSPIRHDHIERFTGQLDADLYDSLLPAARSTRLTRLNLVLAALHASLEELSGQSTVGTSMTTANRSNAKTRDTVGWFASKVILPSRPERLADVEGYLGRFFTQLIDAIEASKVPWSTQIHDLASDGFGYQGQVPYVSFNARSARMRTVTPTDLFTGAHTRRISLRVGWQDAAIATYWDEHEGVHMSADYKTDWYSGADVAELWARTVHHVKVFGSAFSA